MRNQWVHFYTGVVTVKVTGRGLERFINRLSGEGISVWDVRKHGPDSLTLKLTLVHAKQIRHLARDSGCKLKFIGRTGFPFLFRRLLKNSGFLGGAILFILILFLLSNMIWGIEITGADPETEYKIKQELDSIGVKRGQLQFLVDGPEGIQRSISDALEELTWVGVELKGTTYHLQVVEKTIPEEPEKLGPQNLIATKKAVIVDMFVEEGQPKVEIHDHVKPGQLLVSGEIGKEGETKSIAAKGEVFGETWYISEVIQPLKSKFEVFSGNEKRKHYLRIGEFSLPIWGFGAIEFEQYKKESEEKTFQFLKWTLPIAFVEETLRESEDLIRVYSEDEAIKVATERARMDVINGLPEDAEIKGEKILRQREQNGKVYLTMHFQVIENIAKSYPIIQGESE